MKTSHRRSSFVAVATWVGTFLVPTACLERPLCDRDCRPRTTNIFVRTLDQTSVSKIDLLVMIDNSSSMADKQRVLETAVPDLVERLVNPVCVDGETGARAPADVGQPTRPEDICPAPYVREFHPIADIHVGVITSSLGGHGGSLCTEGNEPDPALQQDNDKAHLIATRSRFAPPGGGEPPSPMGFLDWNPHAKPGQEMAPLITTFQAMTTASGEFGCGLESQLESIYRFLVDPKPRLELALLPCSADNPNLCGTPQGVDEALLAQRRAFLRPDSLVAVVMLTDENDCSIRESHQYYLAADRSSYLQGAAVCRTNPNDACCYSCLGAPPKGCPPDPSCQVRDALVDAQENLRCFKQKARFGADFLYPTARYVNAFKARELCTSRADLDPEGCPASDLVPNPLFAAEPGGLPRADSLVFLAGILGVPWQDIQATTVEGPDGEPGPVLQGELHYKTADAMGKDGTWDLILGNPFPGENAPPLLPIDNLMVESMLPRNGNGAIGEAAVQPPSAGLMANRVNGHEWENTVLDDLQYACVFPLKAPKPCADIDPLLKPRPSCDCDVGSEVQKNPLCQADDGSYGTEQRFAKAYPGLRELEVLKGFGKNAVVASICARNLDDSAAQDYGYRPAVDAIVDRLKAELSGLCLPRVLERDQAGEFPCSIVEAVPGGTNCDAARGRRQVDSRVDVPARARLRASGACGGVGQIRCEELTLCEILEAAPECHKDMEYQGTPGWCYVDPANNPEDDASLVRHCHPAEKRMVRFVDPEAQTPAHGARVVIACQGASLDDDDIVVAPSGP